MHPLNYSIEDFRNILNKNITIQYKNHKDEIEEIIGELILIHPTTSGEYLPYSITIKLKSEERTINVFDILKIEL